MSEISIYLNSSAIDVFPTTKRSVAYRSARLLTEENIVNIVNRLLDVDSFVMTPVYEASKPFDINIHGYYIHINNIDNLTESFSSSNSVYASIKIVKDNDYLELSGTDTLLPDIQSEETVYDGVSFSDSEPTAVAEGEYYLKILEKKGNTWSIPFDSQYKYSGAKFKVTEIDSGVLE